VIYLIAAKQNALAPQVAGEGAAQADFGDGLGVIAIELIVGPIDSEVGIVCFVAGDQVAKHGGVVLVACRCGA